MIDTSRRRRTDRRFTAFWGGIVLASLAFPVHFWLASGEVSLVVLGLGLSVPLLGAISAYAFG